MCGSFERPGRRSAIKHYLLDTGVLIRYIRGISQFLRLIESLSHSGVLYISPITRLEIAYGMKKHEKEKTYYLMDELCRTLRTGEDIFKKAEEILVDLRFSGTTISIPDAIIGASAVAYNMTLVTTNKKHYENIPKLEIMDVGE